MNHSEPSSHQGFSRKHWLILAVLILIILAIIWFWQTQDKKSEQTVSPQAAEPRLRPLRSGRGDLPDSDRVRRAGVSVEI